MHSIARQILLAAAKQTGLVAVTVAVLAKVHSKAFGGKKGRRDGITSAFVTACATGTVDQVSYYLGEKNTRAMLESPFQPLNLSQCSKEALHEVSN